MERSLTAQFLHQGVRSLVLDPKRISPLWAKSLPTVTHRGNIAGIHDVLVHLASELERRLNLAGELEDVPRLIVALDEADATLRRLARYWETFRQKGAPTTSPAITALKDALWAERAARGPRHLQREAPAGALGLQAREQFATVILARFTADTWQRLALMAGPPRSRARTRAASMPSSRTAPTRRRRS
ncbi:hypothetical protein [Streptomyces sp. MJM1172]|uniref:hypothetical protein n=1 Tax=Streptomyces sp. MJM1172 TaxID=1703926 RepID=UPI0009639009|nr:hypothetical protein [Streptomyces sp. MJM1172]OKI49392.1 hypothetical protein AMK15_33875 [Streptomyces sp. MJM1172]